MGMPEEEDSAGNPNSPNETSPGGYIPVNNDFDEENITPRGAALLDNEPDSSQGHRIKTVAGQLVDDELRYASLSIGVNCAGTQNPPTGSWTISLPAGIMMWQWHPNGTQVRPEPHWGRVVSGDTSVDEVSPKNYTP
jgi:hypothetical protein